MTPATPFTEDLREVEWSGLKSNLEFLVDSGVNLIYPAGNTGEVMSLSPEEWVRVVEISLDVAGDRVAVLPGIGHEFPVALELAGRAKEMGVDGLLLMPRMQPYVASEGLVDYWHQILETSQLPGVVYKRGLPAEDDLSRLLRHDSVIACKYAEKDISGFAAVVESDSSGTLWTCGIAERYAPFYHQAGAVGFTSGLANFAPHLALGMQRALERGDFEVALEIRSRCLPFESIRARHSDAFNVAAVKAAMDIRGLAGGRVRPPLVDLDEQAMDDVAATTNSLYGESS